MAVRISNRPGASAISLLVFLAALLTLPSGVRAQTDDEIRALIDGAGSKEDYAGASVVVVFDRTDVDVEESGLAHVRKHLCTKVLTCAGALSEAVKRFDYDPASNFIQINNIRIFRNDGTIEEVDLANIRDLFAPARMIYWGARMKVIGLPRLEVGDAIEIRTYKKGFEIAYLGDEQIEEDDERYIPPMRGHYYDQVIFQDSHPVKEKRYDLHVPRSKPVQYEVYNGTLSSSQRFDDEKIHYSWWLLDIPALKRERSMAAVSDIATKLVLATLPSWEEKSRWFDSIHDTIFLDNEEIKNKVREITAGKKSDIEKVAALQHWAAQEIRYSGITMGKGEGYTIHPGSMIFDDRAGVCKDKAGMLITFMRSAGYEVYPALTMAGSRVERVPADQFNHCVVAWRRENGDYTMLDPTWVPYSNELWSSAEQEQNYVIGTPWGEDLMITPYSPPENHVLLIESHANIDKNGYLAGSMKIAGTNYMDQRMRRYLGTHRRDDLKAFIEGWLSSLSNAVELKSYSIGDALDFDADFALEIEYEIPGYALVSDDAIDFSSPACRLPFGSGYLFRASTVTGPKTREHPLFIWFTQTLEWNETIRLPGGMKPLGIDKKVNQDAEYASLTAERMFKGRMLRNNGKILVKRRLIPPESYEDFRRIITEARDYANENIIITGGE
jgi:hypothetical protein